MLKVGDQVIIREDLKDTDYPYRDNSGNQREMGTNNDMIKRKGLIATILNVQDSREVYELDIDKRRWHWVESMFTLIKYTPHELVKLLVEGKIDDEKYKRLLKQIT